jgi:Tol biopolymer transport system component/DNA-binding winged helix-turn-helix (wHTH) protein
MSQQRFYDFDGYRLDVEDRVLLRDDEIIPLTQKAFDVLLILVERHGRVVTKEELLNEVWADTIVEEGSLAQNIYTLRKILGASSTGEDYIKTVPRRGYRFSATVTESGSAEHELPTVELFRQVELKKKKHGAEFPFDHQFVAAVNPPAPPVTVDTPPKLDASRSDAARLSPKISPRKVALLAALLLLTGLVGWLIYRAVKPAAPFNQITLTNLTTTGNIQCVALTPDGKYAVYGIADKPHLSSLRITHLATSTTQTILPPEAVRYHALTISPDGSYIYAVRVQNDANSRVLYRVPMLGRVATKLLDNVETAVAFSPDGKQIAFRRSQAERRESLLIVANADGTKEREVAALKIPDSFGDPAWSPDGNVIVCSGGHAEGGVNKYVVAVRTSDWSKQTILPERWQWIGQVAWLGDSSGLLMVGRREPGDPIQIWRLGYPLGELSQITNDSNSYNHVSLSADGRVMAAIQIKQVTSLWTAPADDIGKAQQITFGAGGYRGKLSWTPEGRIVYDSEAGSRASISIMNADGSSQRQLTDPSQHRAVIGYATATADGRYILFFSDQSGTRQIWRMNMDGSNAVQLTHGQGADHPSPSPDGKWVVFTQQEKADARQPSLWKAPLAGGEAVRLTNEFTAFPAVSPDGTMVACFYSQTTNDSWHPAIYSFASGQLLKAFPQSIKGSPYIRWTPDGQNLVYAENPIGSAKLWKQPIAGGPPQQLLALDAEYIYGFDWAQDGTRLAFVRGLWAQNIVLIKDTK